jgi:hypothetical protein
MPVEDELLLWAEREVQVCKFYQLVRSMFYVLHSSAGRSQSRQGSAEPVRGGWNF